MALQPPVRLALSAACATAAACMTPPPPPPPDMAHVSLETLMAQQAELQVELAQVRSDLAVLLARGSPATDITPARAAAGTGGEAPPPTATPPENAVAIDAAAVAGDLPDVAEPPPERSPASDWVAVAQRLIDDEDCATAIRVLNVAAEVDPISAEVRFHRGVARHLLQSYADALTDFEAAVALTGRTDLALICRYNQACSLARLGRAEEAIDQLLACDKAGFRNLLEQMNVDPDLDSLRDRGRFRDFVMELRTR
jgi:hypothetical protein